MIPTLFRSPLIGCREPYTPEDISSRYCTRDQSPASFCVTFQVMFILLIR
ncbi:hypothetical protein Krac_10243 [Ktedonobacter racemifer DSM 44963]|uniref:Uncharacterized protein n=1 Tax=Ktedonobacter racemifer DSM 44963 TaxID=485913 RepID=D6TG44_KTERA|nr:hypothetical protein Krac_10243 [Ktedonobacter racemifer DSM 44963]